MEERQAVLIGELAIASDAIHEASQMSAAAAEHGGVVRALILGADMYAMLGDSGRADRLIEQARQRAKIAWRFAEDSIAIIEWTEARS